MSPALDVRKVLIVDDEADLRDIFQGILSDLNIQSEQAENGRAALDLLRQKEFHLVLCDIKMPEMDGIDCLMNAQAEGVFTPFVFVTGYGDEDKMLQAMRLGALDFISKPFDTRKVTEVIFRILEVGARKNRIHKLLANSGPEIYDNYLKNEKMISLMRIKNNKGAKGD